jgi:GNAT superfamily N-acetyltransferase
MALEIVPLQPEHKTAWLRLASGYKEFYETPTAEAEYEAAWARLQSGDPVFGLGAILEGRLVGIAHFLFHANVWAPSVCYLQDLFTSPTVRGQGVATSLIKAVAERAKAAGATKFYWLTKASNATARSLYDQVAIHNGFIRYDFPLDPSG